jgi:hypothetical protein
MDAIGNLESWDATLADCMLELIRCAREMFRIELDPDEDVDFWVHAKLVFNREFHAMNTGIHALSLFLHPLCRKLAVSQAAKSRTFEQMCATALDIAKQWRWDKKRASNLVEDLKQYYQCKGPFVGGQAKGKEWWESLPVSSADHPLKAFVITLLSIIPHPAEVERLFSDIGSIQGVKHCNLTVQTFETLGKLRNNYAYHLYIRMGQPRRKHTHMHTRKDPGVDVQLATDLKTNFTWTPPLATNGFVNGGDLEGAEGISEEDIDAAFAELEEQNRNSEEAVIDPQLDGHEITAGNVYDFTELDRVDKGIVPATFDEDTDQIGTESASGSWDIQSLLVSKGVSLS